MFLVPRLAATWTLALGLAGGGGLACGCSVLGGFDELREFFWTRANSVRSASFSARNTAMLPLVMVDQCLYTARVSGGKAASCSRVIGGMATLCAFAALRQDQFNTLTRAVNGYGAAFKPPALYGAQRGDFNLAEAGIKRGLRVLRDVQPRGHQVCQLVSMAIDGAYSAE